MRCGLLSGYCTYVLGSLAPPRGEAPEFATPMTSAFRPPKIDAFSSNRVETNQPHMELRDVYRFELRNVFNGGCRKIPSEAGPLACGSSSSGPGIGVRQ